MKDELSKCRLTFWHINPPPPQKGEFRRFLSQLCRGILAKNIDFSLQYSLFSGHVEHFLERCYTVFFWQFLIFLFDIRKYF